MVEADENWYGTQTGAYHATNNTCGSGNQVSDNVNFFPWWADETMSTYYSLPVPGITCPADQVRVGDVNNTYTAAGNEFDPVVADTCRPTTMVNDQNLLGTLAGYTFMADTTLVMWTITDAFGNNYYCLYNVIVTEGDMMIEPQNEQNLEILTDTKTLTIPTADDGEEDLSINLKLASCPNPFNNSTLITYHIPADGEVILEINDMFGKRIMTLADGIHTTGSYSVRLQGEYLYPGVFMAILRFRSSDDLMFRAIKLIRDR
jgi:hypothetical protein